MPKVTFENGPRSGSDFSFDTDVVVGRGRVADLVVDDHSVSRRHAVLKWSRRECFVVDLGSANGTFVNGRRVTKPTLLKNGDLLTLGVVMTRYTQPDRSQTATATVDMTLLDTPAAKSMVLLSVPADETRAQLRIPDSQLEVAGMTRRLRFLNDLGKISGRDFDQQALLSFVLDQLLELFPLAERAFVLLWDTASRTLTPAGTRMRPGSPPGAIVSRTLLLEAIERQEAILVGDARVDERFVGNDSLRMTGIRSAMCAPLIFDSTIHGVLQIDRGRSAAPFGREEMSLMAGIATHVAMALGFARLHERMVERELLERDLALARKIQGHFLPQHLPKARGYAGAAEYVPAMSVGGDFYDYLELADGLIGIAVGDVSGKGVSAALYAAKLGSDLRHGAIGQTEPRAILEKLNNNLSASDAEGMFATLVLATLDTRHHRLSIANAGHTLPLVRSAAGDVTALGRGGDLPLGISERAAFDQYTHQLNPGDSITFYSDGVTEAMTASEELFGIERLCDTLARLGGTAPEAVRSIMAALRTFVGSAPQSDDITVVCFRRDD